MRKPLTDEHKAKLSLIAKGRSRASDGSFAPATTALEARVAELERENRRFSRVLNDVAHAVQDAGFSWGVFEELPQHIENLSLTCKGACEAAQRCEDSEKKAHELLSLVTKEADDQKAAKRLAEGRYIALRRNRDVELGITWAVVVFLLLPVTYFIGAHK